MNLDVLKKCDHLLSPAHLAVRHSNRKWTPARHLVKINDLLVKAWRTDNSRVAINVPFQHGKLVSHDTSVWTPSGWTTHGSLKVGDYVFAPSGFPVQVEALSKESIADYEVEFSDGSTVQCHGNHEWKVYSQKLRKWMIVETKQLENIDLKYESDGTTRHKYTVPRIMSLVMSEKELLIHPYVLGAWLGDGKSTGTYIAHAASDQEVVQGIVDCGHTITNHWVQENTGVHYTQFDKMRWELKKLKVWDNKHIPDIYLCSSIDQRMELLAGLIDTDGNYSETGGQYRFTNTNKRLIDQVIFLVCSLGFKVGKLQEYPPTTSSSGIEGTKTVYVVTFSPTKEIPCRIPRKRVKKISEQCRLGIVDIRRCEPKPGRCIQVEGGLYLVGERLIPTHNSLLGSIYFPAWVLLLWPETRIGLGSYSDSFACGFGGKVKDIIDEYGPEFDIFLKEDTRAKGEWAIDGYGGGMVCKGRGGSFIGRPVDLLILDDLIKDHIEAQSPTILDSIWDWYQTVAYSRLGPRAPVIGIGTRWGPKDIFGRWDAEAKVGGEKFETINFPAIALEDDDILGRKKGEALFPERVPLKRLQVVEKTRPRWFKACWQGKPVEGEGLNFQPRLWNTFIDVGDAWRIQTGLKWNNYRKVDCTIVIAVDWAQSGKKKSNKTAIVVSAMTDDGLTLILDVVNEHLRLEENAPTLEDICVKWGRLRHGFEGEEDEEDMWEGFKMTHMVVSDDDMLSDSMDLECRRYSAIPLIKRLQIKGRAKIIRAQAAIIRSQNNMFLMPAQKTEWYEEFCDQLSSFTGEEGEEDDIADCVGILGRVADEFRSGEVDYDDEPEGVDDGYIMYDSGDQGFRGM